MGAFQVIRDGLANVMSGRGTSVDRRSANVWVWSLIDPQQVEAAYRTNWLVRKVVDVPAKDMTREGRAWQTDKDKIEKLEAEEKRLGLWPKLLRVLILARLYGGGGLYLSTGDADTSLPLVPDRIGKGGLRFIHVFNRHELETGPKITNPNSEWYGQPAFFKIVTGDAAFQNVKIHPSRMICFIGQAAPEGARFTQSDSWFWGDPIIQSIDEAVKDAMTATAGFASLIDEAKLDIVKIKGLMELVGTQAGEDKVMRRLSIANVGKSIHRALVLDGDEEWEQRQVNWAGIPDVIAAYLNIVAGAADIPVTRLLGQSPKGLQSTGKGEQADYHDKVEADQGEYLKPGLDRVDAALIRSALGADPSDVYWEFNPLDTPDEGKESEIDKRTADTLKVYSDMAIFPEEALAAIAKNRMIESGRFPGCEQAFEEHPDVPEAGPTPDPTEVQTAAQVAAAKVESMRQRKAVNDDQALKLITDARPRTLYVRRQLLNASEFLSWAKAQGFEATLTADELHVTVCFSRQEIDWLKIDSSWDGDDGKLTVPPGGARIVEPLGDKGAVALLFNSSPLAWRHEQMIRAGASHDFEDYQPHVTITYALPEGMRVDEVEPYRGKLVFGPEIFEEFDPDWAPKMGVGEKAAVPFDDAGYDPSQPRETGGPHGGRWTTTIGSFVGRAVAKPKTHEDFVIGTVDANAPASMLGYTRVINAQEVRKNLGKHGADANALTRRDFALIPQIVATGNFRQIGTKSARKPMRVEYRATVDGTRYVYLETVGAERKRVALLSFYRENDGPGG